MSGQEWPTDEEKADLSGYWVSNDREIIARQVAAREKAAAEKALCDAADEFGLYGQREHWRDETRAWLRARAAAVAGVVER